MDYKHIYTKMNESIEPFTLDHNNLMSQLLTKGMMVSEGKGDIESFKNYMTIVMDGLHFPVTESNTLLNNTLENGVFEIYAYDEFYISKVIDHIQTATPPIYDWKCRKVT